MIHHASFFGSRQRLREICVSTAHSPATRRQRGFLGARARLAPTPGTCRLLYSRQVPALRTSGLLILGVLGLACRGVIRATCVQEAGAASATLNTAAVSQPQLPVGATEREITFPAAEGLTLPGTLTLPAATATAAGATAAGVTTARATAAGGKPPIAVLEQGSGVQDRDETVGANRIFQQLAWGLAARGVATLRYDRRAKVDLKSFLAHPDLDHEVVLDAAAALAYAGTLPGVDSRRVLLVGHSLGAELGPDIVALRLKQQPGSVAGLALLAGIARPIDVIIHEQIEAFGKARGLSPTQTAGMQAQYDAIWAKARDPQVPDDTGGLGGGVTVGYFRDWLHRNPLLTLKGLDLPVFVARGTKDLNSPHADFLLLQAAATTHGSQALEFPGLDHEFIALPGAPDGTEVMQPGTVSPALLEALAHWLLSAAAAH